MKAAGVKYIIVDYDSKLHQKQVQEAWKRWGIKLIPGAGKRCHDRKKGRFPVDYPELMPLDRTIHHRWKNEKHGGLCALWNSRKPSRKNVGGFFNDIISSWESIPQSIYENAIEGTRKVCLQIQANDGIIR